MAVTSDVAQARATLTRRKQAVEAFLEALFATHLAAARFSTESYELLDALRQFTLAGGKRLRAALVATGYTCFAEEPAGDQLVSAGAAVELLHAFLLAHDDIIDRDLTRHGVPTLHHFFADRLRHRVPAAEAERHGSSLALLAGDLAKALAFEALAATQAEPSRLLSAIRTLTRVGVEAGYGEALDVLAELEPRVEEARVLLIHRYKTAKYSIEGPLHLGALLAGAGAESLAALSAVALPLGIAYQLQDDLLGVFGSEQVTGKPVGADLREGKQTLLTVHGLGGPFAAPLARLVGTHTLDAAGVRQAQAYLRDGGSLAYSEAAIRRYHNQALAALERLEVRSEARAFLGGLVDLLTNRAG